MSSIKLRKSRSDFASSVVLAARSAVRAATRRSKFAFTSRTSASARLRWVISVLVPIMRSARPCASRCVTRPWLKIQIQAPWAVMMRCSVW